MVDAVSATKLAETASFPADPVRLVETRALELSLDDYRRMPVEKAPDREQTPTATSGPPTVAFTVVFAEPAPKITCVAGVEFAPIGEQEVHVEARESHGSGWRRVWAMSPQSAPGYSGRASLSSRSCRPF